MRRAKVGDVVRVKGKRGRWRVESILETTVNPAEGFRVEPCYWVRREWPMGGVNLLFRSKFRVLRGRNAAHFRTIPKELLAALRPPKRRR